jgi:hypothetical protein
VILLAIDPGKTVGAAVWSEGRLVEHGQCDSFAFLTWMEAIVPLYAGWDLQVVCERYKLGPRSLKTGSDFEWATDVIGTVRYWCRKYDVSLIMQDPAKAKSFSTDDKLRRHLWYLPTPGGHANDAARHLLVRLVEMGKVKP